jgi:ribosomal protein S12 methylthiotransferase accessory factor
VTPFFDTFGLTRIANVTGLDRIGIPVVVVCRPNSRSSAVFQGKGIDILAAKASGVMEAIETWHAEHLDLPLRFGSFAELSKHYRVVDVAGLPRLPDSEFHPNLRILWAEGFDLIDGEPACVPFEIIHADGTMPELLAAGCFASSTNGLASGNHLMEALSHAICEIIERDATSLWNRLPSKKRNGRRVNVGTVTNDACRAVMDRFEKAELDLAVWDTTTDVGVAAFQCLAWDRTREIPHVAYGAGCHPARDVALVRSLTEAAQVRTTYIVGSREDIQHSDYDVATLRNRLLVAKQLMHPVATMGDFQSIATREFASFREEVDWLLDRLRSAGIRQAVAVDLTRPEFGISVVRVVVPGLEGSDHHSGYVPGQRARALMEMGQ